MTGLPSFPDPQTLRRFLRNAPVQLRQQLHRAYDRLLQRFIHLPEHRSRLLFDLDSTVVTSFGHQEGAEVGYNPRYRGKRSYDLLLCLEAKPACGTSMMVAPEGSGASGKSVRTMRCRRFPTRAFEANALYLEVVRLSYNLVALFSGPVSLKNGKV